MDAKDLHPPTFHFKQPNFQNTKISEKVLTPFEFHDQV
jgi:hypothetical protein